MSKRLAQFSNSWKCLNLSFEREWSREEGGGGERERKGFALTRFVGSDIWKALAQFVSCVEKWYYCEKRGDETGPISLDLRLFDSDYRG